MKSSSSSFVCGGGIFFIYSYLFWLFLSSAAFFLRYYYSCLALYRVAPPKRSSFVTLFVYGILFYITFEELIFY